MIREIEFRGKNYAGEWVYGNLMQYANGDAEIWEIFNPDIDTDCRDWAVIPKTVGQYTGLKDKNGVKIFEGDILACGDGRVPTLVFWDTENNCWSARNLPRQEEHKLNKHFKRFIGEVIGNIHDNPELFGGAGE